MNGIYEIVCGFFFFIFNFFYYFLKKIISRSPSLPRLSLCDLAGSERCNKTQTFGERLKEAGNINNSLLILGKCIAGLRNNQGERYGCSAGGNGFILNTVTIYECDGLLIQCLRGWMTFPSNMLQ